MYLKSRQRLTTLRVSWGLCQNSGSWISTFESAISQALKFLMLLVFVFRRNDCYGPSGYWNPQINLANAERGRNVCIPLHLSEKMWPVSQDLQCGRSCHWLNYVSERPKAHVWHSSGHPKSECLNQSYNLWLFESYLCPSWIHTASHGEQAQALLLLTAIPTFFRTNISQPQTLLSFSHSSYFWPKEEFQAFCGR